MGKRKNPDNVVSAVAAMLGRRGGAARAIALSPRRRREIAKLAAAASAKVRSAKARAKWRAR